MSDSKTASRSIYIDQSSAERSLEKLTGSMTKLEAEIAKGTKAGKDMATQIAKLSDTKKNIDQVKDALEKGLAPTFRQQQQLVRELDRSLKNMSESAPGYADKFKAYKNATGELDRMKQSFKGVDDAQKEVVKNSSALTRAGAGIASFFGNLAANAVQSAISGIGGFFSGAIEESNQAETSLSRLKNVLDNLGRGDAFDRIVDKSNELADQFKFLDNDDITEVFQQLISYGKLTENQMNDLLPVIINFASKSGLSLSEASDAIVLSLEGKTNPALKKMGVNLKEGSTVAERFGIVMEELAPKVEGAAEAFGKTFPGKVAIAQQQIANLKEDIGNKLQPVLLAFYSVVSSSIDALASGFSRLTGPSNSASEEVKKLAANVTSLEKNTVPLINRVDELGNKTNLSKAEQVELNKAIQSIAQTIPSAVTQWDSLGNAIAISTDKAREYISIQQNVLKEKNRDQIKDFQATLDELNAQFQAKQKAIAFAASNDIRSTYSDAYIKTYAKTEADLVRGQENRGKYIARLNKDLSELTGRIQGVQGNIDELTGKGLDADLKAKQEAINKAKVLGTGDPNADPAAAKKAEEERKKAEDEAKARLEKYNEFIRGINSSITELLSPEASKKWVEILVKTTDEMDKLKKLTQNDQQYQEGKKRILEEQAAAVHRLYEEESKLYKAVPEQVSTADPNSLPAGLRNSLPKAPIKAPITIIPEITLADEKAATASLAAAFDKLKRNNDAATRIAINFGSPNERREALLQDLELQHDAEINNKNLTDNEKLELEKTYQQRKLEINIEYIQQGLQFAADASDIVGKFNRAADSRENAQLKNELKGNDVKKAAYKKQLDEKVISQQRYNQLVHGLDKDAEDKKEALAKKQFERNKKLQLVQAGINGAQAVLSTLEKFGPPIPPNFLGIGAMILTLGTIAAEVTEIAGSKYGKGGKLNGPSHSSGGMPVINPDTGRKEAEVEGGEYILSKDTVRNNREIADALLFASMQRSGARVRPFWEKRPYSSLDYKGIARNMQTLRFAEGGIAPGKSTAADEATTATQTIVIESKDDEMKSLLRALTLRLSQPIEVSHTKIKDAYALEQRQLNDAALK